MSPTPENPGEHEDAREPENAGPENTASENAASENAEPDVAESDAEFDDELRRLFDDERLGVRPRAGAEQAIVAGARRVRRRRNLVTSGSGALAVAAVVLGGVALSNQSHEQDLPPLAADTATSTDLPTSGSPQSPSAAQPPSVPPSLPTSTSDSQPTSSSPEASPSRGPSSATPSATPRRLPNRGGPQLGPDGYAGLYLGMSLEKAKKTGKLVTDDSDAISGCRTYQLKEGSGAVDGVVISAAKGVALFNARGAQTPEGVGVGTSEADVKAAYPSGGSGPNGFYADAGSSGKYNFSISGGSLTGFSLELSNQDCVG